MSEFAEPARNDPPPTQRHLIVTIVSHHKILRTPLMPFGCYQYVKTVSLNHVIYLCYVRHPASVIFLMMKLWSCTDYDLTHFSNCNWVRWLSEYRFISIARFCGMPYPVILIHVSKNTLCSDSRIPTCIL